jgi:CheY-like chemotaxis protein
VLGAKRIEILLVQSPGTSVSLAADFEATGLLNIVRTVSTAEAALACLRGTDTQQPLEPALILVDLSPSTEETGLALDLEFLSDVKSDPRLWTIPVVVLTENAAEADVLNAYSKGACSFVSKPSTPSERRTLITRFAQYWSQVAQLPKTVDRTSDEPWFDQEELTIRDSKVLQRVEVLVVDDNEDDVLLLREAFAGSSLVDFITTVEDGEEAMQYLRKQGKYTNAKRPGLILLDINMPRKNGFEVLADIRSDANLRNIPVVMLTTSKHESDILRAYSTGACSFISKPVNFDKMRLIAQQFTVYWTQVANVPDRDNQSHPC